MHSPGKFPIKKVPHKLSSSYSCWDAAPFFLAAENSVAIKSSVFTLQRCFIQPRLLLLSAGCCFCLFGAEGGNNLLFFQTAEEVSGWMSLWNKIPRFRLCFLIVFSVKLLITTHTLIHLAFWRSRDNFEVIEYSFSKFSKFFNVISVNEVSCWMSLEQTHPCQLPQRLWFLMGALIDTVRWRWNLW